MKLNITKEQLDIIIWMLEANHDRELDYIFQLEKMKEQFDISNSFIEIELWKSNYDIVYSDMDLVQENFKEFGLDLKEANDLKEMIGAKIKPKNITFEEAESAIEHTEQCLYFMKKHFKKHGEFEFDDVLEKWVYSCIRVIREEV